MRAVKANKEYVIEESQKKFYQDAGFDILDETGKTIAYGRGKTVPYATYAEAVNALAEANAENAALKARVEQLEEAGAAPEKMAEKAKEKAAGKKAGE